VVRLGAARAAQRVQIKVATLDVLNTCCERVLEAIHLSVQQQRHRDMMQAG
jgi:hypothetical protein